MPKARTIANTTASTAVPTSIPHSEKRAAGRSARARKVTASGVNSPAGAAQDVSFANDIVVFRRAGYYMLTTADVAKLARIWVSLDCHVSERRIEEQTYGRLGACPTFYAGRARSDDG